jgi:predicted acylesterase/phospholipase RssA
MLGRLEMDVGDCIKSYILICETIFTNKKTFPVNLRGNIRARFKKEPLEDAIKDAIAKHGLSEDDLLKKPDGRCKVYVHPQRMLRANSVRFVCATSGNTSTPFLFRSYPSPGGTTTLYHETKIWEAARATSAAPTFFEPIQIGSTNRTFGDGGIGTNNPISELWNEAIDICDGNPLLQNLACIVSIGTGVPNLKKFGKGIQEVVDSITRVCTETEITANSFNRSHPELSDGQQRYFRFNAPRGVAEIGLDEASEAGTIEDMTDVYLRDENTVKQIRQCARMIADGNLGTQAA